MIEEYRFGTIIIDSQVYNQDVEVRWLFDKPKLEDRAEVLDWPRSDSHTIDVEDIKEAVEKKPDTIVIGTGESGMAQITEEAKQFIDQNGIKLIADITEEAVKTFNVILEDSIAEEGEQNKIIGFFHLTC